MRIALIDDEDVIQAISSVDPTYYIRNKMSYKYPCLDTASLLRKLKDMEKRGLVTRVPSQYCLNNISWSVIK
ncbi:hypothetical protein PQZ64_gp60 [Klebsiella phage vB_KpnM_IME346]|uniref:Uncharacterized protein n=1 Tax=Klebsiella phage vB_KpnM_IME346 TaxID=2562174 RepID=A0A4D6DT92_9CAUD|nr:hypothetical protein PQZ64_gp60 [Klebsiella phage vB_KpnM_IME346]QBZ68959.1 hypothetical protein [Klebsiella phage vB_KpnM_IME346]